VNVKGIVLESEAGREYLISTQRDERKGVTSLVVRERQRRGWVVAPLPLQQRLGMLALALIGASKMTERFDREGDERTQSVCESPEFLVEEAGSRSSGCN